MSKNETQDKQMQLNKELGEYAGVGSNEFFRLMMECLKAGADPNSDAYDGINTPLLRAIMGYDGGSEENRLVRVTVLVHYGADVNLAGHDGQITPLMAAARENFPDIISYLLNQHADYDFRDKRGATALIIAASRGYDKVVDLLLGAGAERDSVQTEHNMNALHYAVKNGHVKVIRLLMERDAITADELAIIRESLFSEDKRTVAPLREMERNLNAL